jgi:hypothetical protein
MIFPSENNIYINENEPAKERCIENERAKA